MKKIIMLMLGLVAGTASFAQQTVSSGTATPTPLVSVTADHKLKLIIGQQTALAIVSLWDANGHQLYTERVSLQDGLYQKFNLTDLVSGTYRLTVTTGSETATRTFVVDEKPAEKQVILQQA